MIEHNVAAQDVTVKFLIIKIRKGVKGCQGASEIFA
jgi:hypothetical protein